MKFKLIFLLFNFIVLLSFVFVFVMPIFFIGADYAFGFWGQYWYLILVFVVILVMLNVYFVYNRKLFSLFDKEDWSGLADYLSVRVMQQKKLSEQNIRLLCTAWIVQGKTSELKKLEEFLRAQKPELIKKYGMFLGIPYLQNANPESSLVFYRELANDPKVSDPEWMRFFYAFTLLSANQMPPAIDILDSLADQKKERVVQLMALYLLQVRNQEGAGTDEVAQRAIQKRLAARQEFLQKFSHSKFQRLVDRSRENLQLIVLMPFINEASTWMFTSTADVKIESRSENKG